VAAFTMPIRFLTAIQQQFSRKSNIPIDSIGWEMTVVPMDESEVYSKESIMIHGLYLEGAGWDGKNGFLRDANAMELTCALPKINLKPIEIKKKSLKGIYLCPLYHYPTRSGTRYFYLY
jgi:dynein heavy chain